MSSVSGFSKITASWRARRTPMLLAAPKPTFSSSKTTSVAACASATRAVSSFDALSMTTIS